MALLLPVVSPIVIVPVPKLAPLTVPETVPALIVTPPAKLTELLPRINCEVLLF